MQPQCIQSWPGHSSLINDKLQRLEGGGGPFAGWTTAGTGKHRLVANLAAIVRNRRSENRGDASSAAAPG